MTMRRLEFLSYNSDLALRLLLLARSSDVPAMAAHCRTTRLADRKMNVRCEMGSAESHYGPLQVQSHCSESS